MKKMFEYELVRRMYYREDLSKREISRRTGYHRTTINKMLRYSQPPGYRRQMPPHSPKIAPFIPVIDQILKQDSTAPRKQRHTAKRIYRRLKEEHGFTGGYTIIKDYVRDKKIRKREVFLPLNQRPGTSQIDFGSARVIIDGKEEIAHVFCMSLPYSDAIFAKAYPTEASEAMQDGHVSAYEFFNGVPPEGLYDNMSTAVKRVFMGGARELTDAFIALRSHYLFRSQFCNVACPNEKGVVEQLVGYVRRNFFVPMPRFRSWDDLNAYLEQECLKRFDQRASGKEKVVGELLEEDKKTFLRLPATRFECCRMESRGVSSLSLVRFKNNSYSVPVRYAYRDVIVKAFWDRIDICWKNETIATHQRHYGRCEYIFDPLHYLPLLEQKPGALDGAMPFSSWELPDCFESLRRLMESRTGNNGKREYIQVLQLLRDYTIPEVSRAIQKAFRYRSFNFEAIKMLILSEKEPSIHIIRLSEDQLAGLPRIQIEMSNTAQYQGLLTGGAS